MNSFEKMFCKACVLYGVYKTTDFAIRFGKGIVKEFKNKRSEIKQTKEA